MARSRLSIEEKILDYFQTAPLDAANVTLRFATKTMRDRTPATTAKPARKPKTPKTPPPPSQPNEQQATPPATGGLNFKA